MMADTELLQELREIKNLLRQGRSKLSDDVLIGRYNGFAMSETDRWIQAMAQVIAEVELRVRGPFTGGVDD